MEIARHIDVLSEYSCILKPHRCIEFARHINALSEDSYILKPHELSDVG
ncbi:unnamed protein product [Ectocarpus sp. CCAP 1310/34]|nr:unnamed protein product [Ectocarpus sp. CCAP 1310/34]